MSALLIAKAVVVAAMTTFWLWFSFTRFRKIVALINSGRDEALFEEPARRFKRVINLVFLEKKLLEEPVAGIMHAFFFYGFLTLGIGHMELLLSGVTAPLTPDTLTGLLYEDFLPASINHIYHFSQDLMAIFMVVMSTAALIRRFSGTVDRLMPRSLDAEIILWFILALYITFFLFIGSWSGFLMHRGAQDVAWQWYWPVSSQIGIWLHTLDEGTLWTLREIGYWLHLTIFLAFGCYITISKHMHVVFAAPNIYFSRPRPGEPDYAKEHPGLGLPPPIDFMDETLEKYGVDQVYQYSWKTLLDTFACTECGRCNAVCPAHLTGKPLAPKKVLHDIKDNLRYKNAEASAKFRDAMGRVLPGKEEELKAWEPEVPLINRDEIDHSDKTQVGPDGKYLKVEGQIHLDEAWACTTCGACAAVCPVTIDSVPGSLIGIRQTMVMMEADFPAELEPAFRGMETQGNPWGVGQGKREEWAAKLDVKTMSSLGEDEQVEYLFWVGCAGATDDRAKKTQQALVRVLKRAGVDFAILGCEEKCTGDPARRLGNEYVFDALARENVEVLNSYQEAGKFKKIFASCPHCLNSLGNEYGALGGKYEVRHHSELLAELLKDKRIPLETKDALKEDVVFHDPCYLGRYNAVYDEPRAVLNAIPGVTSTEMERHHDRSFCCGAGGGRVFAEEHIGKRVNEERTEQALVALGGVKKGSGEERDGKSKPKKTIAVGCPFCMTMITDGTKAKDVEDDVAVKDIAELLAERLADAEA